MGKMDYNKIAKIYRTSPKEELVQKVLAGEQIESDDRDAANELCSGMSSANIDELFNSLDQFYLNANYKTAAKVYEQIKNAKDSWLYISNILKKMEHPNRYQDVLDSIKRDLETSDHDDKGDLDIRPRSQEVIKEEYIRTKENDEMIQDPNHQRVYVMKNQDWRNRLQEEWNKTLPDNQQLAIYLHNKLCHSSHSCDCYFFHEIADLEHNWKAYAHKKYLKKANFIIDFINRYDIDIKIVMGIIDGLTM